MHISLVNFSNISDAEVLRVLRSINRQLRDDFTPHWHWTAQVRLEGCSPLNDLTAPSIRALHSAPQDLRGDAILYLWDKVGQAKDALGYHDNNNRGLPYGFVFTDVAKELDGEWSITLSHEVLELVGDANVNCFAAGPHPVQRSRIVFHWYEMCDAVQAESYMLDGVVVSNFVLPLYFTVGEQVGARNDFLNQTLRGKGLRSFGVKPGGYVGFYDPRKGDHVTYAPDDEAKRRMQIKARMGRARRAPLYRQLKTTPGASPRLTPRPLRRVSSKAG